MAETFQDRFCRHFKVPPEKFADTLLRRVLYPRARLLYAVIRCFDRDHFSADRHFVEGVGRLTQRREFHTELKDFQFHPDNRGLLRGGLRLRASASRMSKIFFEVWAADPEAAPEAASSSEIPFDLPRPPVTDVRPPESA